MAHIECVFYFEDVEQNRKSLFEEALRGAASRGRVLYILHDELNELPQLSQEFNSLNKFYMKMISFLYVKNLDSLIETISNLSDWQNIPATIILDDLGAYCNKNDLQNAVGVVALLINVAQCCSTSLDSNFKLCISACKKYLGEDYCTVLQDLCSCNKIEANKLH